MEKKNMTKIADVERRRREEADKRTAREIRNLLVGVVLVGVAVGGVASWQEYRREVQRREAERREIERRERVENEAQIEAGRMAEAANRAFREYGKERTITLPGGATMEMIYCPPGAFMMGSPASEVGRDSDEAQHRVTLTKGFWLGKYAVTQRQWKSVMGSNPSNWKGENLPVENVTWQDCQEFIGKVNAQLKCGARLPTEAEWEYACRAGTTTAYSWGNALNGDKANCEGNFPCGTDVKGVSLERTVEVDKYAPNPWGFFCMHGNVWEWCGDWYDENYYKRSPANDPQGPASGIYRVLRGGCWNYLASACRSAHRRRCTPVYHNYREYNGFRLCCSEGP